MQNFQLLKTAFLISTLAISHAGWATDGDSQTAYENLMQISGSPLQELPDELQLKIHGYVAHDGPVAWTRLMGTDKRNCVLVKGEEEQYFGSEEMEQLDENEGKLMEVMGKLLILRTITDELRTTTDEEDQERLTIMKKIQKLEQTRSSDFPNPHYLKDDQSQYERDWIALRKKRFMESKKKEIQEFNQQIEQILQEAEPLLRSHQNIIDPGLLELSLNMEKMSDQLPERLNQNRIVLEQLQAQAEQFNAVEILEKLKSNFEQHQKIIEILPQVMEIHSKYRTCLLQFKNLQEYQEIKKKITKELRKNGLPTSESFFIYRFPIDQLKSSLETKKQEIEGAILDLMSKKLLYKLRFNKLFRSHKQQIRILEEGDETKPVSEDLKNKLQQHKENLEKLEKDYSTILAFFPFNLFNNDSLTLESGDIETIAELIAVERSQTIKTSIINLKNAMTTFCADTRLLQAEFEMYYSKKAPYAIIHKFLSLFFAVYPHSLLNQRMDI